MIPLDYLPRTEAEAQAAMLLTRVAEIGKIYYEVFLSRPSTDFDHGVAEMKNIAANYVEDEYAAYFLERTIDEITTMDEALKSAQKFLAKEFMSAIDEFNAACDAVKNDTRPRSKILEEDGWQRTKDEKTGISGWTRGKTFIKDGSEFSSASLSDNFSEEGND